MSLFKLVGEVFVDTSQAENSLNKVDVQAEKAGKKMSNLGKTVKDAGTKISSVGKKLTTALTLPIVAAGVASVKTAADFDASMSQVQATLGITKDDMSELNGETVNTMEALSNLAIQMGSTTAFSASECAEAINTLAMAGLSTSEIYEALPTTLNLAAAGGISIAEAATYATGCVKGFGDSMDNANYYADLIAKGASLANTDVSELGAAFSDVSATANTYGQSADSTVLSLLRLAEANITGSEAATGLSAAMTRVYAPTNEAKEAMDALGVSAYDSDGKARDFNDVVDDLNVALGDMSEEEANAATKAIFGSSRLGIFNDMAAATTDTVEKFNTELNNASGTAEEMANTQLDNLSGSVTILKSSIEGMAISIGEKLTPYVQTLTDKVQAATDWFNNLDTESQDLVIKIALVAAAIGPVLTVLGGLVGMIGTVIGVVGTMTTAIAGGATVFGALGAAFGVANLAAIGIVAAIAAVIAIGVLLYKNWDTIKEKLIAFSNTAKNSFEKLKSDVTNKMNHIKENVTNAWEGIKGRASENIESMKNAAKNGFEAIKTHVINPITEAAGKVKEKFTELKNNMTNTLETAKASVQDKLDGIKNKFKDTFDGVKDTVKNAIEKVKGFLKGELKFPHIKVPHFKISGGVIPWGIGGAGTKPTVSVSWYKKAMNEPMMLDKPTIFGQSGDTLLGAGEAGTEVVSGAKTLMSMIENAVGDDGSTNAVLTEILAELKYMRGGMYETIVAALQAMNVKFDERELARLVRKYA